MRSTTTMTRTSEATIRLLREYRFALVTRALDREDFDATEYLKVPADQLIQAALRGAIRGVKATASPAFSAIENDWTPENPTK